MSDHSMLRCRRIEQEAAELLWQEFGEEFPYVPFPLEYINVQWDPSIPIPDYYEQPITPPSSATSLSNAGRHSVGFLGSPLGSTSVVISDYYDQAEITPPLVNRETVHVFPSIGPWSFEQRTASFVLQEDGGSTARSQHALMTELAYSGGTFASQRTQRLQSAPESVSTTAPPSVSVSPQRMRRKRGADRARRTLPGPRKESRKVQWLRDYPGCLPEGRVLLVLLGKATAINAEAQHVRPRARGAIADMVTKMVAFHYGVIADPSNNVSKANNILKTGREKHSMHGDDWSEFNPRLRLSKDEIISLIRYDENCKLSVKHTIEYCKRLHDSRR